MACMQAVEQGKLKLDDSSQVYELCPELKKVKVLQDDGSLAEKKVGNSASKSGYCSVNADIR